jgi:hypothetical protein
MIKKHAMMARMVRFMWAVGHFDRLTSSCGTGEMEARIQERLPWPQGAPLANSSKVSHASTLRPKAYEAFGLLDGLIDGVHALHSKHYPSPGPPSIPG